MIERTFEEIETKIRHATTISDARKDELLLLLGQLKLEIGLIATTHVEKAKAITRHAEISAREITREIENPQARENSANSLRSSVEGFEQSHPQLVQVVNNIANTLSNLGI